MKIKYLKDAPQGKVGDVVDLDPAYATAFIAMGYAEPYTEVKDKPKTTAKTKTTKKDNE